MGMARSCKSDYLLSRPLAYTAFADECAGELIRWTTRTLPSECIARRRLRKIATERSTSVSPEGSLVRKLRFIPLKQ